MILRVWKIGHEARRSGQATDVGGNTACCNVEGMSLPSTLGLKTTMYFRSDTRIQRPASSPIRP